MCLLLCHRDGQSVRCKRVGVEVWEYFQNRAEVSTTVAVYKPTTCL